MQASYSLPKVHRQGIKSPKSEAYMSQGATRTKLYFSSFSLLKEAKVRITSLTRALAIMWIARYLLLEVEINRIPQKNNKIKPSISHGGK